MGELLSGLAETEEISLAVLIGALFGVVVYFYLQRSGHNVDLNAAIALGALLASLVRRLLVAPLLAPLERLRRRQNMYRKLLFTYSPTLPLNIKQRTQLRQSVVQDYLKHA